VNFATFEFAIFMVCVYLPYLVMSHRLQNYLLLIASYIFYGWWDWRFLSLILFTTAVNYLLGIAIYYTENIGKRRFYLLIALCLTFGLLGIFKYLGFFVDSMVNLLEILGFHPNLPMLNIVLPIGISFYTFQTTSYTIDIFRKELKPTQDFIDFAVFIAFFPQLVAGPIERAKNLLPQIQAPHNPTFDQFTRGSYLILLGLFKKVVIADGLASTVNMIYSTDTGLTTLDVILATYLFSIQIYCDFSGYSDIARGTAKLLGIEIMTNFRQPWLAINPRDFWQRWHISLSTWFRDYLYIPLGGNRKGEIKTHQNLLITFLVSGLWHGAAWHFVLWGLYHALLLSIDRFWQNVTMKSSETRRDILVKPLWQRVFFYTLGILLFYQVVAYGWMIFRAESLAQVVEFTRILLFDFSFHSSVKFSLPIVTIAAIPLLFMLEIIQFTTNDVLFYRKLPIPIRTLLYTVIFFILMAGTSNVNNDFIYFAF
jgi:D-alanyl-lipoteichoic acid acyltransferase DltB (MBOAT superfamily)